MPIMTYSGRLVPTDEYAAINIPELPTQSLPAIRKTSVGIWRPPSEAIECSVQHCRLVDLPRIFFGVNEYKRTVENASHAEFAVFIEQHGYDMLSYQEPPISAMMRRDAVNALLMQGRLRLSRIGEGDQTVFFLVPPLSCQELAQEHLWDTQQCCPVCHGPGTTLIKHTLTRDHRTAMLCCHASRFIESYPRYLPEYPLPCEWDDGDQMNELSPSALD